MAYVRLSDGRTKNLSHQKALLIWEVLNGKKEPTIEQAEFCSKIHAVYLSWRRAPDDYLTAMRHDIVPKVLGHWMCDRRGNITRPETVDRECWRVSEFYGLIFQGAVSKEVHNYNMTENYGRG